ncbi:MAG: hypothetical protein M0Q93_03410 [Terrimicrobiaceae bacterium]|nr:hypothetical protein [Terrimicrobiaceae bacterium]
MFRRVVVSFAIPWSQEKKKTNKRTSTCNFLEHLNADNHRPRLRPRHLQGPKRMGRLDILLFLSGIFP